MAGNSNRLADQQGNATTAMGATAGIKRKLSAEQKDARKIHRTESLEGDEDNYASDIDTEQENGTSDSDEGDDNEDSEEGIFGHGDDMLDKNGDEDEEDEEDYDEFQEFKWLKAINFSITETGAAVTTSRSLQSYVHRSPTDSSCFPSWHGGT